MNANNPVLGSDLACVDGHGIQPEEYAEIPELTEDDLRRAVWKIGGREVSEAEGRAAFAAGMKKRKINGYVCVKCWSLVPARDGAHWYSQ